MAAGIGSRYGKGVKQLAKVGPSGELIMDYSVHDAVEAGFDKVIFILRKSIFDEFKEAIGNRIGQMANVEYAFQELDDLPGDFTCPEGRTKPWGTGQAVLSCKDIIDSSFVVINADDYYGKEPYRIMHDYLVNETSQGDGIADICCAGFKLGNTLSDHGGVTRGICHLDSNGYLTGIDETKNIIKTASGASVEKDGKEIALDPDSFVSMNMWGFEKEFVDLLKDGFTQFLSALPAGDTSSEYLLPIYVDQLIKEKKARVKVLPTDAEWFGVTYQEDTPLVKQAFADLVAKGVYKENLYA